MDRSTSNRSGNPARAAFGHLVPTTAPEPPPSRFPTLNIPGLTRSQPRTDQPVATPSLNAAAMLAPERRPSRLAGRATVITDHARSEPTLAPAPATTSYDTFAAEPVPQPPTNTAPSTPRSRLGTAFGGLSFNLRHVAIAGLVLALAASWVVKRQRAAVQGEPPAQASAAARAVTAPAAAVPSAPPAKAAAANSAVADAPAQSAPANEPAKRQRSANVIDVRSGDARMNAARETARASLATFWEHAANPGLGESDFALKVALPTRSGSLEHIWAAVEGREGTAIRVRLSNQPVDLAGLSLGSPLAVSEAQISDWMYRRDGKIVGGHSIRALIETMPPAQAAKVRAMLAAP